MRPLILLLCLSFSLHAQDWVRLADFPGNSRDDGVAALSGNKVYFGTGLQEWWIPSRNFYALDLDGYSWDTIRPMPAGEERQYACSFTGNNSFFVFGGDENGALNDLHRYDIATNTWSLMASKPGTGLMGASCMVFGDKVIVTGGKITQQGPVSDEVWEYNVLSNIWTQKKNFPFTRTTRASAVSFKGKGYMMFGLDDSSRYTNHMYSYDVVKDEWLKLPDFPHGEGRAYCGLQASAQKLVLFAGHSEHNVYHDDVWYFSDTLSGWTPGPEFPALPRRATMCALAGDRFVFSCGLGHGDVRLKETWMLDVPLSVEEHVSGRSFPVFPQPAGDALYIGLQNATPCHVLIGDLSGKKVLEFPFYEEGVAMDVSGLSPGLYQLQIWKGGQRLGCRKFAKQ